VRIKALRERGIWLQACAVLVVLLICLAGATLASAASTFPLRVTRYAKVSRACLAPKPGHAACFALVREPVSSAAAGEAGVTPYTIGDGALESGPDGGLTPAELASAYGYSPAAGGSGQTIAIVDAYDDPSIASDLAVFDADYGIAACTKANGCLTKVSQTGSTTSLPPADTSGWSVEISLDVEVAHSACPKCKILLVEAKTASFQNLATAVNEAVALGATEVSNSYGGPESELGTTEREAYSHAGVVIAAATGDDGYYDWTEANAGVLPPERPNMPASIPSVVAVGGTTLELDSAGKRSDETVWNGNGPLNESFFEYGLAEGASGGGCSTLFTAEPWQQDAQGFAATACGNKRLAADVSADANPYTGFDIYDSYECGEACKKLRGGRDWLTIGGTSLSTPLISSLYALAGGSDGVDYPSLTVYGHLGESADLYDVTEGSNGFCDDGGLACGANDFYGLDVDCEGTTACNAGPGVDGPSGVGTPNSLNLFKPLLPSAAITPPSAAKVGLATSFSGLSSSDPYPGGTISSYSWSWGDGTSSGAGAEATHTYSVPGEYTVTLTVTDSYGLKSTPAMVVVKVDARTAKELEEEEAKKRAEEEAAKKKHEKEEEAKKRAEEEAAKKKHEKEEAAKKKAEEEAAAVKEAEEEAAAVRKAGEEAVVKEAEEEAAAKKKAGEQAAANKKAEEEVAAKQKAEEEAVAKSSTNGGSLGVSGFHSSAPPPVPDAELAGTLLQVSASGTVTLKISCPAGESSCAGTVTLRTLGAVIAADGYTAKRKPAVVTLATGSFSLAGGAVRSVTLHLTEKARVLLARSRTLRARAMLLAHDPQDASHTTNTLITLRAPKPRHKG
jgi:PKD repeat protein